MSEDAFLDGDVTKHCGVCDSQNVWLDANAEWDVKSQQWVRKNTFDEAYCDHCDCSTHIISKPVQETSEDE